MAVLWFVIGVVVGGAIGAVIAALCAASSKYNFDYSKIDENGLPKGDENE